MSTGRIKYLKKKERQLHISNAISGKGEKQRKQAQKLSIRTLVKVVIRLDFILLKFCILVELAFIPKFGFK